MRKITEGDLLMIVREYENKGTLVARGILNKGTEILVMKEGYAVEKGDKTGTVWAIENINTFLRWLEDPKRRGEEYYVRKWIKKKGKKRINVMRIEWIPENKIPELPKRAVCLKAMVSENEIEEAGWYNYGQKPPLIFRLKNGEMWKCTWSMKVERVR